MEQGIPCGRRSQFDDSDGKQKYYQLKKICNLFLDQAYRFINSSMTSSIKMARTAGLLYLFIIIFGLIAQIFVRDSLVDYENANTTARNILASEFWYRFGFVSELLMLVCDIGVATLFYLLLKETSQALSLLSTLFRFASIIILAVTALSHYTALSFLREAEYLGVFNTEQLNAFVLLSIKTHGIGYNICLLFFGFHLLFLGHLINKSLIIPTLIGTLLLIGGICYIANSLIWFLFPQLVKVIYPAILIPCAIGEWIFCLWLIIKGLKKTK